MVTRPHLVLAIAATVLFAPALAPTGSTAVGTAMAASGNCQPAIEFISKAYRKKAKAKRKARNGWQRKARKAYGFRFRRWTRAANRETPCTPTGRQYYCTYTGSPCPTNSLGDALVPEGEITTSPSGN